MIARFATVEEVAPGKFVALELVYHCGRWLVAAVLRQANDAIWLEQWLKRRGAYVL